MIDGPTTAPAGSAEKIEVMRQRAAKKMPTDHPQDTRQMVEQRHDPEPPAAAIF